jgi:V/A-type H+-transporting ATPase subunit C
MVALLGPVRYAAPNAGVRARLAQRLSTNRWAQLLAAPDLDAVIALLGTTAYGAPLAAATGQTPEPEQVEQQLRAYLIQAFRVPFKLMQGKPRTLLDWLWRRFELENVKTVIRSVARNRPPRDIRAALPPLGRGSELPWDAMIEAQSLPALLPSLRTTFHGEQYAHALEPAMERYGREGELFVLEVALDLAYYRRLLRLLDGLAGRDRRDAGRFVGTLIDGHNLLWAFRYRVYFDLSPEEILNYTLQRRLRVDAAMVREIALGASLPEATRAVWNDRLPDLERLEELPPAEALPELELIVRRYLYTLAQRALEGYPFHLGTILAYTVLLESDVQDLIAIAEGKAANWSAEQIRPTLIGSRG